MTSAPGPAIAAGSGLEDEMANLLRCTDNVPGQPVFQGFCADISKTQEITIPAGGVSSPLDVTGWLAISWNAKDGLTRITRRMNDCPTGRTAVERTEPLWHNVTAVTFEAAEGTVIEVEGMA